VLAALAAVGAMLAVRRVARPGGLYGGARGIGVYSAVQGSLGVLIAFVIFLAFQSYLGARSAAQDEATAVLQLFRTAELFPRPYGAQEEQHLVCYARAVASPEWRTMKKERGSPLVDAAVARTEATFAAAERSGPVSGPVASTWLSNADERAQGRQRRLAEAAPFVPPVLWVMLIGGAVVVISFLLGFADRSERALGQALIAAAPAVILSSGLVLIYFFDHPYEGLSGSIQPVAMERALDRMTAIQHATGVPPAPCPTRA
jgi:hypothetical protein